jgi:hypothetical protein
LTTLADLRDRIAELSGFPVGSSQAKEAERLKVSLRKAAQEVYGNLSR